MLGQSVIPKQIEIMKSEYRLLQVKTYIYWRQFSKHVSHFLIYTQAIIAALWRKSQLASVWKGFWKVWENCT